MKGASPFLRYSTGWVNVVGAMYVERINVRSVYKYVVCDDVFIRKGGYEDNKRHAKGDDAGSEAGG